MDDIKASFQKYDVDKSGSITLHEAYLVLQVRFIFIWGQHKFFEAITQLQRPHVLLVNCCSELCNTLCRVHFVQTACKSVKHVEASHRLTHSPTLIHSFPQSSYSDSFLPPFLLLWFIHSLIPPTLDSSLPSFLLLWFIPLPIPPTLIHFFSHSSYSNSFLFSFLPSDSSLPTSPHTDSFPPSFLSLWFLPSLIPPTLIPSFPHSSHSDSFLLSFLSLWFLPSLIPPTLIPSFPHSSYSDSFLLSFLPFWFIPSLIPPTLNHSFPHSSFSDSFLSSLLSSVVPCCRMSWASVRIRLNGWSRPTIGTATTNSTTKSSSGSTGKYRKSENKFLNS